MSAKLYKGGAKQGMCKGVCNDVMYIFDARMDGLKIHQRDIKRKLLLLDCVNLHQLIVIMPTQKREPVC